MIKKPTFKQTPEAVVLGLISGLLVIYLLLQWRMHQTVPELIYVSAGIGLLSVLSKKVTEWVAVAWMWLGQLMGKVVGSVLLTVVYLLILTPLAKLQGLFAKSEKFSSKTKKGVQSSWHERRHQFETKDLDELW